jgi:hypothetical protein
LKKILVIGPARSGTTFLSRAIGRLYDMPVVVEPHLLWKYGELKYFNDDEFLIDKINSKYIHDSIMMFSNEKGVVEKSPINCIRAMKVFSVFPDAVVVYVNRDRRKIVRSNIVRSENKDQFSLSIFMEKFFRRKGGGALSTKNEIYIGLKRQIGGRYFDFFWYALRGFFWKSMGLLPFGPRVKGFNSESLDLNKYYDEVLNEAERNLTLYRKLYGDNFFVFDMDDFGASFESLVAWLDMPYSHDEFSLVVNESKVKESR